MSILDDPRADRNLLETFRFDVERWQRQVGAIVRGEAANLGGVIAGAIEPMTSIAEMSFDEGGDEASRGSGTTALARGEVGVVILNGGLATRFGGAVKGVVEALPGRSFLSLKLDDVAHAERMFGGRIPVVLMNSFATRDVTLAHLAQHDCFGLERERVFTMDQTISIRLEEDGRPFVGAEGRFLYYAPGHGEFFDVLRQSGVHRRLVESGVRWLLFSNVDNVGATVEPALLGHHIGRGVDMTVEVTRKGRNAAGGWDVGGSPAVVDGQPQIVEGLRFPPDFDQSVLPDIQTNNMIFSLGAIAEPIAIPPYLVRKRVDGRDSLAFEAITCEASGVRRPDGSPRLLLSVVRVPRDGVHGRFFPVKSREDLEAMRPALAERLERGWQRREREANR